jgi:hypothetical protein
VTEFRAAIQTIARQRCRRVFYQPEPAEQSAQSRNRLPMVIEGVIFGSGIEASEPTSQSAA